MKTGIITTDTYLNHNTGQGHPERADRVTVVIDHLKKLKSKNLIWKKPAKFDLKYLEYAHDKEYLNKMNENIPKVIDEFEPDFIFYLSGVDILKNDRLGRLGVSLDGCKKRDKMILDLCKRNNIPLQISMGGGYSSDLKDIIEAHSNTFRLAQEIIF